MLRLNFFTACIAILMLVIPPLAIAVEPPLEYFTLQPTSQHHTLSPSGKYIAWIENGEEHDRIVVVNLSGEEPPQIIKMDSALISELRWANDDRLIFAQKATHYIDIYPRRRTNYSVGQPQFFYSIEKDGSNLIPLILDKKQSKKASELFKKSDFPEELQAGSLRVSEARAEIIDILPNEPKNILMASYEAPTLLHKVNVFTGEFEKVDKGNDATFAWIVNSNGQPVMRMDSYRGGKVTNIKIKKPDDSTWKHHIKVYEENRSEFWPVAATENPDKVYVIARPPGEDLASFYTYDLATETFSSPLAVDTGVDIDSVLITESGEFFATSTEQDRLAYEFKDRDLANHYNALQDYVGAEESLYIRQISIDGNIWLIEAQSPQNPGAWLFYDKAAATIKLIEWANKRLNPEMLGRTSPWSYSSRDGVLIPSYLTLPQVSGGAPPPLVVMPHGGPEARDYYRYDPFAQMLGSRGYAVLQPNFRGSSGYGQKYTEAGYGEWGGRMQDDVIDGVKALVSEGKVDPDRICIVGSSYGGYVALAGAFLTPDLFKCAIGINGVYDLPEMLEYDDEKFGSRSDEFEYVKKTMGDPRRDSERLERLSPQNRVSEIDIPVLLIHGDQDDVVPVEQARALYAAMEAAGKDVTYEELQGIDHNLQGEINGLFLTLKHMDTFLEEHLQPQD